MPSALAYRMVLAADIEVGIGPGAGSGLGARAFLGTNAGPGTGASSNTRILSGVGVGARAKSRADATGSNEVVLRSGGMTKAAPNAGNENFRSFWQAMLKESSTGDGVLRATKPGVTIPTDDAEQEEIPNAGGSGSARATLCCAASKGSAAIASADEQENLSPVNPTAAPVAWLTASSAAAYVPAGTQARGGRAHGMVIAQPASRAAADQPSSQASAPVIARASKQTGRGSTNHQAGTNAQVPETAPVPFDSPFPPIPAFAPLVLPVSAAADPVASFHSAQGLHRPREKAVLSAANSLSGTPQQSIPRKESGLAVPTDRATADGSQFTRMPEQSSAPPAAPMVGTAWGARSGLHSSGPGNGASLHSIAERANSAEERNEPSDTTDAGEDNPTISQSESPAPSTLLAGQSATAEVSATIHRPAFGAAAGANLNVTTSTQTAAAQFSPTSAAAEVHGPNHGERSLAPPMSQSVRRSQAGQTAPQAVREVVLEAPEAAPGTSAPSRPPNGMRGLMEAGSARANPPATDSAGLATRTGAQQIWAALDAGTGVGESGWTHAGVQHAEAGFQDPSLGWVGVRADLSGGSVHAVLLPGSADAAQALSAHLPGLSTYLSEEHARVSTLTIAEAETAAGESRDAAGTGQSPQQNANREAGQGGAREPQPGSQVNPPAASGVAIRGVQAASKSPDMFFPVGASRGTHISVMA